MTVTVDLLGNHLPQVYAAVAVLAGLLALVAAIARSSGRATAAAELAIAHEALDLLGQTVDRVLDGEEVADAMIAELLRDQHSKAAQALAERAVNGELAKNPPQGTPSAPRPLMRGAGGSLLVIAALMLSGCALTASKAERARFLAVCPDWLEYSRHDPRLSKDELEDREALGRAWDADTAPVTSENP